jgi:hypothetical protein
MAGRDCIPRINDFNVSARILIRANAKPVTDPTNSARKKPINALRRLNETADSNRFCSIKEISDFQTPMGLGNAYGFHQWNTDVDK